MFLFPKDSYLELIHHGTKSAQKQIQEIIQVDLEMCPGWRGITNMAFKQRFIRAYIAVQSVYFIRWPGIRTKTLICQDWILASGVKILKTKIFLGEMPSMSPTSFPRNFTENPPVAAHHRGRWRGRSPCHRNWNRPFCWPTHKGIGHQTQHHFFGEVLRSIFDFYLPNDLYFLENETYPMINLKSLK